MKFNLYYWKTQRALLISQQQSQQIPLLCSIFYNITMNFDRQNKFCYYLFIFFCLFSNFDKNYYIIFAKWLKLWNTYLFQLIIKLKNFYYFLNFLYFSSIIDNLNSYINNNIYKFYKKLSIIKLPFNFLNNFILLNNLLKHNFLLYKKLQIFKFNIIIKTFIYKKWYSLEVIIRYFMRLSFTIYINKK